MRSARFFLAAIALAGLPALAATYIVPTDEALIRKAGSVVRGRVMDVASVESPDGGIETHVTIEVARVLKGQVGAGRIVVRQPGGTVGDHGEYYPGIGGFVADEQVLLMLDPSDAGRYRVTDFALGNFRVLTTPDGTEFLRREGLRDAFLLSPSDSLAAPAGSSANTPGADVSSPADSGGSPSREMDRDAAGFERYIAAVASGLSPRTDYLLPAPMPAEERYAAFTFLGAPPARWNQFDNETSVIYQDSSAGDPGTMCSSGCHAQIAAAPAIWSAATGTQILLQYGGTVSGISSKCLPALNNQINFNDPCHELTDLSGCAGTLALGGFSSSATSGGAPPCPAKGNPTFNKINVAKIMINNGTGNCLNSCDYTTMITHEIGHTIGAGHSTDSSALMGTFLNSGICGVLQADDVAFAQCVYPQTALTCNLTASRVWGGPAPLSVTFNSGVGGGVPPLVFDYDLGDGTASTASAPVHSFAAPGTFSVDMTISDSHDQTCSDSVTITVQPCLTSNVTAATGVTTSIQVKAVVVGTGFKNGSVVQIDSGGGFVSAPSTKRKTNKKLIAKDIGAIWPAGVPVIVRVLSSTGCPSNPVPAIR